MPKIGRPTVLPDRAMSGAERMHRHRYARLGRYDAESDEAQIPSRSVSAQLVSTGPTDVIGNELAFAMFDLATHTANRARWDEIDRNVREGLTRLEQEFPVSSLIRQRTGLPENPIKIAPSTAIRGLASEYAVMTIDRMLPELDGVAIIRRLREGGIATPALIISTLGEVDDRVRGLRAGGDESRGTNSDLGSSSFRPFTGIWPPAFI